MKFRHHASFNESVSIGLHWFMLLLMVAVYAAINLRELFPKGSDPREAMKTWHYMLGLSVFFLVWLRLAVRMTAPARQVERLLPVWQMRLGKLMHVALYALMIGMPMLGWMILSAGGKPIPFFGLHLPALIGESKTVADWGKEIHEAGGTVGYFLIGLHASAALVHHYILRDDTLRRMLPHRD